MVCRAMGVAMQQNLRLCLRQPVACGVRVDIGVRHATLFAVFALLAQALGDGLSRWVLSDWDLHAQPPRGEVLRCEQGVWSRVPVLPHRTA